MPTSKIQYFQKMNRVVHFDAPGGGTITRTFYVEPYTSHMTLLTALKGTIYERDPGFWDRVKPDSDPLCPKFYCVDAVAVPFSRPAVKGSAPTGFDPDAADDGNATGNGQITEVKKALQKMDDFDFASNPDTCTAQEIQEGGIDETDAEEGFISRGRCGAFVTATYKPLIVMQGLPTFNSNPETGYDPFDYVDPRWAPATHLTQLGRNLLVFAPDNPSGEQPGPVIQALSGSDTQTIPEMVWTFTVRRLMVPFIPKLTFGLFANKLNFDTVRLGNLTFPPGTMRMRTPDEPELGMSPDGQTWWNITLSFDVRMTWDTYFNYTGQANAGPADFIKGWIDWNHQLCIPATRVFGAQVNKMLYWPIGWNDGVFQVFGANRGMFLYDKDVDTTILANGAAVLADMGVAPFSTGFRVGQ